MSYTHSSARGRQSNIWHSCEEQSRHQQARRGSFAAAVHSRPVQFSTVKIRPDVQQGYLSSRKRVYQRVFLRLCVHMHCIWREFTNSGHLHSDKGTQRTIITLICFLVKLNRTCSGAKSLIIRKLIEQMRQTDRFDSSESYLRRLSDTRRISPRSFRFTIDTSGKLQSSFRTASF